MQNKDFKKLDKLYKKLEKEYKKYLKQFRKDLKDARAYEKMASNSPFARVVRGFQETADTNKLENVVASFYETLEARDYLQFNLTDKAVMDFVETHDTPISELANKHQTCYSVWNDFAELLEHKD